MDIHQAATLLQSLRTLHQRHLAPDLTIVLDDGAQTRIPVHKALVAMFSGYFRNLLENGELAGNEHHLNGVESDELMLLIDFMYTGSMFLTEDNYARVMSVAKRLQIPFAVEECENFKDRFESSRTLASLCESVPLAIDLDIDESTQDVIGRKEQENGEIETAGDNPNTSDTMVVISDAVQSMAKSMIMKPDGGKNSKPAPLVKRRGRKRNLKEEEYVDDNCKTSDRLQDDGIQSATDCRRSKRYAAQSESLEMSKKPKVAKKPKVESKVQINERVTSERSGLRSKNKIDDYAALSMLSQGTAKVKRMRKVKRDDTLIESDNIPALTQMQSPSEVKSRTSRARNKNESEDSVVTNVPSKVEPETSANYGVYNKSTRLLNNFTIHPSKTSKCEYCKKLFLWRSTRELHMRTHGCVPLRHQITSKVIDARVSSFVILPRKPLESITEYPAFVKSNLGKLSPGALGDSRDIVAGHEYVIQPGQLLNAVSDKLHEQTNSVPDFLALRNPDDQPEARGNNNQICKIKSGNVKGKCKVYSFLRNKDKSYVCGFCGQGYPLYGLCKRHISSKHCVMQQCPCCPFRIATQKALLQHRRLTHADKPQMTMQRGLCKPKTAIKCSSCEVEFKGRAMYSKHSCFPVFNEKESVVTQGLQQRRKLTKSMVKKVKSGGRVRFCCRINCKRTCNTLYLARIHAIHKHKKSKLYHKIKQECPQVSIPCLEDGCHHEASSYIGLTTHIRTCHPEARYGCPQCSYKTPVKSNIPVHIKQKHPEKVSCDLCGKTYSRLNQLTIHKAAAHDIEDSSVMKCPCPVEGCAYVAYQKSCLIQHMAKHDTEKRFKCNLCRLKLKTERNLQKHMNKIHLGIRPYICDQCGASYGEASELKTHMMRHAPTHKFKCDHCSYKSDSKGSLKSHMWSLHRMVLNNKQTLFTCDICGYTTDRKTRSREHYNSHKNVRNFQCTTCNQTFVTKSTLLTHIKWKHQDKKLKCDFCDYQTGTNYHLKEHVRVKHTHRHLKPYKCPYCEFYSATGGNCRKHVINRHKGKEVWYEVFETELDLPAKDLGVRKEMSGGIMETPKPNKQCTQVIHPGGVVSYLEIEQDAEVTQGSSTVYSKDPANGKLEPVQTSQSSGYENTRVGRLPEIEVQVFNQSTLVTTASLTPATRGVLTNNLAYQTVFENSLLFDPPVGAQSVTVVTDPVHEATSGSHTPLIVLPPSAEHSYYGTAP